MRNRNNVVWNIQQTTAELENKMNLYDAGKGNF